MGRIYPKVQLMFSAINQLCALEGRIYPKVQLMFSAINLL